MAMKNLRTYFKKLGMEVLMLSHSRRFVGANIYRNGRTVDSLVFDIVINRMRSAN